MKIEKALAIARTDPDRIARPTAWADTAQGLVWSEGEQGWIHRHVAPNPGALGYASGPARMPERPEKGAEWEVVHKSVLDVEGVALARRNRAEPTLVIPGKDHRIQHRPFVGRKLRGEVAAGGDTGRGLKRGEKAP
jgi:hypothetical protein